MKSGSTLERVLRSGEFAVTAEMNAPDTADPEAVYEQANLLAPSCDAINAVDSSGANSHLSSVAAAGLLAAVGHDVVMQLACRDRNRIALQADLLGGAVLGVQNVLCLTGDGVQAGDQPGARPVFDMDSLMLLRTARIMRDKGCFLSGRKLEAAPKFFLGAASNPFAPPYEFRPVRLGKKIEAGADFIQTQFCFDMPRFRKFMSSVVDAGLHERVYILAGVGLLRSARAAERIRSRVPGVVIPDEIVARLKGAPRGKQREEGRRICIEIVKEMQEIKGVSGVHVMAYRQEELVPEIMEASGLLPRPMAGQQSFEELSK